MDDIYFIKDNLTDFEKLLFTEEYIKELKELLKKSEIKNGKLKSENDELIYIIKKEHPQKWEREALIEKAKKYKSKYEKCFEELCKLRVKNKSIH